MFKGVRFAKSDGEGKKADGGSAAASSGAGGSQAKAASSLPRTVRGTDIVSDSVLRRAVRPFGVEALGRGRVWLRGSEGGIRQATRNMQAMEAVETNTPVRCWQTASLMAPSRIA